MKLVLHNSPTQFPSSRKNIFLFFCLLASLWSCQPAYHTEETHRFAEEQWLYDAALKYDFEIQDTSARYNFFLDIRHSIDFPYQNIYTKIKTIYPEGVKSEDIISLELANKLDLWAGKCKKDYCYLRVQLQTEALFKEQGKYALQFEQFTRQDTLDGLKSMALIIEKI